MAIKLQHILETDDKFRRATGLPQLDIPEHLWGVRDMRSAHTREQDFMAITAEVEVLCQQLKGRGMYTVPSTASTTSSSKIGGNVHFQLIDPAQKSSVQAMDQLLLNSSLNLLDDSQFVDALQQTIQMGVDAQAQENKNARMDKQFEKVKVFDGSKPSECHPWLEEVHVLCIQTGRPFREMLLLCAGQAVHDFITDMSLDSDLQGLGCKQSAYDSIMQQPDEPLRSYIVRYSRLFKLLNGTAPDDVRMRTTSMHFVNSLRNYLSSKVENRLLGMNEKNYSLGDTFKVALECELKAIASERRHAKHTMG